MAGKIMRRVTTTGTRQTTTTYTDPTTTIVVVSDHESGEPRPAGDVTTDLDAMLSEWHDFGLSLADALLAYYRFADFASEEAHAAAIAKASAAGLLDSNGLNDTWSFQRPFYDANLDKTGTLTREQLDSDIALMRELAVEHGSAFLSIWIQQREMWTDIPPCLVYGEDVPIRQNLMTDVDDNDVPLIQMNQRAIKLTVRHALMDIRSAERAWHCFHFDSHEKREDF